MQLGDAQTTDSAGPRGNAHAAVRWNKETSCDSTCSLLLTSV